MTIQSEWIAVDWGTSNVRAWGMTNSNEIAFSAQSDQGMSKLTPDQYPDILLGLLDGHLADVNRNIDVVICGMAGAKQGWMEAPYLETPANLGELGKKAIAPVMPSSGLKPRILSGVCQSANGDEDVMRGEETQLLGLLDLRPGFSGIVCLPGTHSKWAKIENGALKSFTTAMTGELFELLRKHSVLRHSLTDELTGENTDDGISQGLSESVESPQLLTSKLFKTRAASLLSGRQPDWCAGYLSGLLVGSEVAGHKNWLSDEPIPLIGSAQLCSLYTKALGMVGAKTEIIDATKATLAGLSAARKQIIK